MSTGGLDDFSLMDLFRMEAETQTNVLSEGLLELEDDPGSVERVDELMRAAHSLKGAARIVNLEPAVAISHKMEDRFVEVQEGKLTLTSSDVDHLLAALDLLKAIGLWEEAEIEAKTAETQSELDGILGRLDQIGAAESSPPPSTEADPAPKPESEPEPEPTKPAEAAKPAEPKVPPTESSPVPTKTAKEEKTEEKAPTPPEKPKQDGVVRVGAENLSRLMELAAESLVESRQLAPTTERLTAIRSQQLVLESTLTDLKRQLSSLGVDDSARSRLEDAYRQASVARHQLDDYLQHFDDFVRRNGRLADHLYQETLASRMRPFEEGVVGYPRLVRDLAKTLQKKVKLKILGKATEVDRDVLERLDAPLNHILRNAMDHGLESPEERQKNGKPETGSITLEARHHAGMLNIRISDDGKGIDLDRLRSKVVEKGLTSEELAAGLTDAELLEFLFLPAFSTTDKVTEISGRGVGLDVVQNLMQDLGGTVRIDTVPGKGATFHLQLPITRSVIRALILEIAGEPYAVPISRVDRICQPERDQIEHIEGRQFIEVDGKNIGLVTARMVLELEPASKPSPNASVLVVSDRSHQYGLEVDRFLGEKELVVRPLDKRLGKVRDINAAAIHEDGNPLLILDVDDLVRSIDSILSGDTAFLLQSSGAPNTGDSQRAKRILVADDSITVRQLQKQLLESHGYDVQIAVDGMEAWNAVRLGEFDLLVTDVDMPRMTGIELVGRIREEPRLNDLPAIIVSYKDREQDRLAGLEVGANLYLTKSSFQDESYLNGVMDLIGAAKG